MVMNDNTEFSYVIFNFREEDSKVVLNNIYTVTVRPKGITNNVENNSRPSDILINSNSFIESSFNKKGSKGRSGSQNANHLQKIHSEYARKDIHKDMTKYMDVFKRSEKVDKELQQDPSKLSEYQFESVAMNFASIRKTSLTPLYPGKPFRNLLRRTESNASFASEVLDLITSFEKKNSVVDALSEMGFEYSPATLKSLNFSVEGKGLKRFAKNIIAKDKKNLSFSIWEADKDGNNKFGNLSILQFSMSKLSLSLSNFFKNQGIYHKDNAVGVTFHMKTDKKESKLNVPKKIRVKFMVETQNELNAPLFYGILPGESKLSRIVVLEKGTDMVDGAKVQNLYIITTK
jgi:hypothetical protein